MTLSLETRANLAEQRYSVCRKRHLPSKEVGKELRDLRFRALRQWNRKKRRAK